MKFILPLIQRFDVFEHWSISYCQNSKNKYQNSIFANMNVLPVCHDAIFEAEAFIQCNISRFLWLQQHIQHMVCNISFSSHFVNHLYFSYNSFSARVTLVDKFSARNYSCGGYCSFPYVFANCKLIICSIFTSECAFIA